MTGKAMTVFIAAMFASQVALTAVSFAKGKKGKGGTSTTTTTVVSLKAKLAPVPPPTTPVAADLSGECEGQAKYKNKTTTKLSPPSTSTEESFTGEVECPFLVVDDALTAVVEMHLARGGVDYAVCSLVIKEIEFEYNSGSPLVPVGIEGEYAVKVSQKSPPTPPTMKQKVGGCTDTLGTTQLVPAVQKDDTATVFLNGAPLLTGPFGLSSRSDDDDDDRDD